MARQTPRIKAIQRDRLGTRYAARLRRGGKLPAVVYGHEEAPSHVAVDREDMLHILHEGSYMLELELDGGGTESCLLKAVQYDHLGTDVIHLDFARTSLTEEVEVTVPIQLKGREDAPGLKTTGAIVSQSLVDLGVRCRANVIPDEIIVDISQMEAGDTITVGDLDLPDGVTTDQSPEESVVSIQVVEEYEEAEEAAEGAGAEPEVLREKKEGQE